jgi:hypothetical protein
MGGTAEQTGMEPAAAASVQSPWRSTSAALGPLPPAPAIVDGVFRQVNHHRPVFAERLGRR